MSMSYEDLQDTSRSIPRVASIRGPFMMGLRRHFPAQEHLGEKVQQDAALSTRHLMDAKSLHIPCIQNHQQGLVVDEPSA